MNILKKYWVAAALVGIIAGAVFARTYHFEEWLYFKMDQSRDAFLISNAINDGPLALPLLGPRVGAVHLEHGMLRLGPIFYYFQYIAGTLFHSIDPSVLAYPELFFSILAIPLLFFFTRLYFSTKHALLVVAMYAFSFLIVQYSRFSWNPNSLQFFELLAFFGLLKFLNADTDRYRRRWLAVWATGLAIGSQLHFFGFFSLIGTSGLMLLFHYRAWETASWRRLLRKGTWRELSLSVGIVLVVFGVFYSPVVISDVMRHGENTHNFFEALGAKPSKQAFTDKVVKDVTETLHYYCLLTTSRCTTDDIGGEKVAVSLVGALLAFGLYLSLRGIRSARSTLEKDFLALLVVWAGVFFILSIPLAYQLRPRFFIVVFAIPFLFLGLSYRYVEDRFGKRLLWAPFAVTALVLLSNFNGTYKWFREQALSQSQSVDVRRTLILKAKDGVTLGQLRGAADFIYEKHRPGNTVYFYVKPEHINPIRYMLFLKNDPALVYTPMKINDDPHAEYFAIVPSDSGTEKLTKKFGDIFTILSSRQYGQITVYQVDVKNRDISFEFRFNKKNGKSDRLFWEDVLGGGDMPINNIDLGE